MSIDIRDNLSHLTALLTKGAPPNGTQTLNSIRDGAFAERLERALDPSGNQVNTSTQPSAQALAETLSLQMLHTSLSLGSNDSEKTPQIFDRQSPQFQALVKAYASNQNESAPSTATQPTTRSQLQDMSEISASTPTAPVTQVSNASQGIEAIIAKASNRYNVDAGLIKAVIKAESSFNPNAVSHAGAQGLMQLMPGTARSLGVSDSFDPEQNVMGGTRFLRDLLKRYNGNLDSALAAYNWGPGNVDKRPDHLPRETRDYLARVKQLYNSYSA